MQEQREKSPGKKPYLRAARIAICAALLAVMPLTGAGAREVITLKMHQFLPAGANIPKLILQEWADTVEKDSGGRIKINHFPSMQLGGGPADLVDQAVNGVADIIWTLPGYTPGRFPTTEVFELPFMMEDNRALSCAYWIMADKHMKETEFRNLHVLGAWVHGPGVLHTAEPVEEISDLRGMKIRGGSRIVSEMLRTIGATPVGMPAPAITESLSRGVIDGATLPWEVTEALKVPELVGNHTQFEGPALYTLTFLFAMNREKYESLPDDLKEVIDRNSGLGFSVAASAIHETIDAAARDNAADNGNAIFTISDENELRAWRDATTPARIEWVADMNAKGYDGEALVAEARATQDQCATRF